MASTTYIPFGPPTIDADWLNEVNGTVWTLFNAATTASAGRTALGASSIGSTIFTAANAAAVRSALSLGTAALENTGTSGHTLPFLDGTNAWSGATNTFDQGLTLTTAPAAFDNSTLVPNTSWVQTEITALGNNTVGQVIMVPVNAAPAGTVKLNGALLSRATYANLWSFAQASGNISANDGSWVLGGFSPGDGSTTFRIPDYRGLFIRAWADDGVTYDPGRVIGSLQTSQNLSHFHTAPGITSGTGGSDIFSYNAGGYTMNGQTSSSGGSEARPVNIPVLFCIKY